MHKTYVGGLGEVPAKPASEIKLNDKIIIDYRQMGHVTDIKYSDDYVRMTLKDGATNTEFSISKSMNSLVGFIEINDPTLKE